MSAAAVVQGTEARQLQYVVQAPQQEVVYAVAPQPVSFVEASGAYPMAQPVGQVMYIQEDGQQTLAEGHQIQYIQGDGQQVFVEGQQIQYMQGDGQQVLGEGQEIQYVQGDGQQVFIEGQEFVGAPTELAGQANWGSEGMEGHQLICESPWVVAAPARVNVSHEVFAKLVAGGSLAPEEMAQLSGQPAPAPVVLESSQAAEAVGEPSLALESSKDSGKKDKDEKDEAGSKMALKASKKKKEKSCC